MLNRKTKALLRVIYDRAIRKDGVCIAKSVDLLSEIPYKIEFLREDFEPSMKALMMEGYFEAVETEKKGEMYYCITLLQGGYDFSRQIASEKRAIKFKVVLTVCGVIGSLILPRIISAIIGAGA